MKSWVSGKLNSLVATMRGQAATILACSLVLGLHVASQELHSYPGENQRSQPTGGAGAGGWGQASASTQPRGVLPPSPAPPSTTRCYFCSECAAVLPTTPWKYSPPTFDPNRKDKCVVFSVKYNDIGKSMVIRGTAAERGTCHQIRQTHKKHDFVTVDYCNECVGDLCNTSAAGRSILDTTVATVTILIAQLLVKQIMA